MVMRRNFKISVDIKQKVCYNLLTKFKHLFQKQTQKKQIAAKIT